MRLSKSLLGAIGLTLFPLGLAHAGMLSLERDGAAQITAQIENRPAAVFSVVEGDSAPVQFSFKGLNGKRVVSIGKPLPFKVRSDGVDMDISQHMGLIDGNEAVVTMENGSIHVSYNQQAGEGAERVHVLLEGNRAQEQIWETEVADREKPMNVDLELEIPQEFMPADEGFSAGSSEGQPVTIFVFVHNDVRENESKLTRELFTWWAVQMIEMNKRHMSQGSPSLFSELVVDFRTDNRIQSFNYKGTPKDKLRELAWEFQRYKKEAGILGSYRRNKMLLVTENMMNWQTLGVAYVGGQYGMAADDDDQTAAHEIGHMFNGSHENADIWYNGWWCETIIYWQHLPLRASCHQYTNKNMDAISNHLK